MIDLGIYKLRHATPIDKKRIDEFYKKNAHTHNIERGDNILLKAIRDNRKMFIVEEEGGEIVGASAVFNHLNGRFREAGATRIILNGFKLQQYFHSARAVHEYIMDADYNEYFSTVVAGNNRSIRNVEAAHFEHWRTPDSSLVTAKKRLASKYKRNTDIVYYRLPLIAIKKHAKTLLSMKDGIELFRQSYEKKGESERIFLKFDLESLNYHQPIVEKLIRTLRIHD